jgi:hypothetical protein
VKTAPFLSETDLATFAPLPPDQKRKALQGYKQGKPPYSYKPVRQSLPDLLNLEMGLFGPSAPVPFERIADIIRANSRFQAEEDANIRVAAGLHAQAWRGRPQPFPAMMTTIGQRLTYWTPAVLAIDGRPVIPFFNPRRSPLPEHGRRFVFSMMHEQIRVADPDYAAAALCICHFAASHTGTRAVRPIYDTGVDLYSFDQLQEMVAETYAIWAEVWAGRVEETRQRGGGRGGGLV